MEYFSKLVNHFKETDKFVTGHFSERPLLCFMRFKDVPWWTENISSMIFDLTVLLINQS